VIIFHQSAPDTIFCCLFRSS